MPTQAPQRRTGTTYRGHYEYDTGTGRAQSSSARVYDFPTARPRPKEKPDTEIKSRTAVKVVPKKRTSPWVALGRIALVAGMCVLMLYRYAAILESNAQIEKLTAEVADIEAKNQAIQAKIDRGLELGNLEEYATGQLGMIRPDGSQIFYIDMQLGDASPVPKKENHAVGNALQGTPGALVHAIQVLK